MQLLFNRCRENGISWLGNLRWANTMISGNNSMRHTLNSNFSKNQRWIGCRGLARKGLSGGRDKAMVGSIRGHKPLTLGLKVASVFPSLGLFVLYPISKKYWTHSSVFLATCDVLLWKVHTCRTSNYTSFCVLLSEYVYVCILILKTSYF